MKNNQKGFGSGLIILLTVVTGLIVVAGWLVYERQNKQNNTYQAEDSKKPETDKDEPLKYSYVMPIGWEKMNCTDGVIHAYPPDDKANSCEDGTNIIIISQDPYATSEPVACYTEEEVAEIRKSKPLEGYSCTTTTIAGKKATKTRMDQGTGELSERVVTINYTFDFARPLRFRYSSTADGKLPHAAVLDELVSSVSFQQ